MRAALLILAVLLALPASAEWTAGTSAAGPVWVTATEIGINPANSKGPVALFANSAYPQYHPPRGVWHQVDVTRWGIPADAKAVLLSGILLITHGYAQQTCDVQMAFRAPGDTLDAGNYILQTIEAAVGSGQRSNAATIVPLRGGRFEWQWRLPSETGAGYPAECAYGFNLSLQAWFR